MILQYNVSAFCCRSHRKISHAPIHLLCSRFLLSISSALIASFLQLPSNRISIPRRRKALIDVIYQPLARSLVSPGNRNHPCP
ncbi:hypothetical protein L207DRAFT_146253 [Hyaloscypha variabilis F]|uniref:Uncharacterized protein n=1 Tax=Hyaloscypha variabilis (strain UAMH 11265 / GT02V1 / F) TaxID=1149755 RepID=A0A2J6R5I0_HYAVF|nr:hypothetical protein L207DRAFT_146253 [Hyaloscypha variabilis F]